MMRLVYMLMATLLSVGVAAAPPPICVTSGGSGATPDHAAAPAKPIDLADAVARAHRRETGADRQQPPNTDDPSWARLTMVYVDYATGMDLRTFTPDRIIFNFRNEHGQWERLRMTVTKREQFAVYLSLERPDGKRFRVSKRDQRPYLLQEQFKPGLRDQTGNSYDADPYTPGRQQFITRRIQLQPSGAWDLLPLMPGDLN